MSQSYAEQIHSRFKIEESALEEVVYRATNEAISACERWVRGYMNEVYSVVTEGGTEVVVRIRRGGDVGFLEEAWAIQQAGLVGVPVAEVLLVDTFNEVDTPVEVMVQRKVDGTPLPQALEALTDRQISVLEAEIGLVIGQLHSIKVGGYYHLNPGGVWDFATWDEIASSIRKDRTAEIPYILECGFTQQEGRTLLGFVHKLVDEFPCRQPVLCHGDLARDHILVADDGNTIAGLIDFGDFQGGSPMVDMADLLKSYPRLRIQGVAQGYPDKSLFERFEVHETLHNIAFLVGLLPYLTEIGDTDLLQKNTLLLRQKLDQGLALVG
ncbi:MAG: aminoglycoside phosphotransferase family protein [Armatimonadetes bacterium]|nr:aminoglycoside phosphotransferase family protein [Armatimonadota bacterium]